MKKILITVLFLITVLALTVSGKSPVTNLRHGSMPTNDRYEYLSFDFENGNGKYSVFLSGFVTDCDDTSEFEEMAFDIAESFENRKVMKISSEDCPYRFEFNPVDAEKMLGDKPDSLLCWAAAGSNMLDIAGYTGEYGNADEIFDLCRDSFYDFPCENGPYCTAYWYFCGTHPLQAKDEITGEYIFSDENTSDLGNSQLKNSSFHGAFPNILPSETVFSHYGDKNSSEYLDEEIKLIKKGYSIGIDISYFEKDPNVITSDWHVITVLGYILDETGKTAAVFASDSDNDMRHKGDKKPDSVTMYTASGTSLETEEGKISVYEIENYGKDKTHGWAVTDVFVLKPLKEPVIPNPFRDVKEKDYYYYPVLWAAENYITRGTEKDLFSPKAFCTRAQIVTFLWRAAGKPEVTGENIPFIDVRSSDYFCNAVQWAVENGITKGITESTFEPNSICTRAQTVTFLWRSKGFPGFSSGKSKFSDVKKTDYFSDAVSWAVENEITKGVSDSEFAPFGICSRGEIVTFLFRSK